MLSINVRKGHFEDFWKAALDKKCQVYVAELDNDVKVPIPLMPLMPPHLSKAGTARGVWGTAYGPRIATHGNAVTEHPRGSPVQ